MSIAMRKSSPQMAGGDTSTAGFVKSPDKLRSCIWKDQAFRFLQPVRGTPPYWKKVQYKLLPAIKQLGRHIYPSLVLVKPGMTHPCLTERLLKGRKE